MFTASQNHSTNLTDIQCLNWGFQGGASWSNTSANARDIRDMDSIPGSRRFPGEGHGDPLQYSCLENPMDRGAWWATVHVVIKSWIQLKWLSMHTHAQCLNNWFIVYLVIDSGKDYKHISCCSILNKSRIQLSLNHIYFISGVLNCVNMLEYKTLFLPWKYQLKGLGNFILSKWNLTDDTQIEYWLSHMLNTGC